MKKVIKIVSFSLVSDVNFAASLKKKEEERDRNKPRKKVLINSVMKYAYNCTMRMSWG